MSRFLLFFLILVLSLPAMAQRQLDSANPTSENKAICQLYTPRLFVQCNGSKPSRNELNEPNPLILSEIRRGQRIPKMDSVTMLIFPMFQIGNDSARRFLYQAKSIHIRRTSWNGDTDIVSDLDWTQLSDTLRYTVALDRLFRDELDGKYRISIDSLILFEPSTGIKLYPEHWYGFSKEIYRWKDPLADQFGPISIQATWPGKSEVTKNVTKRTVVEITLGFDSEYAKSHPEECNFLFQDVGIGERGCFGFSGIMKLNPEKDFQPSVRFRIPMDQLKLEYGGMYYLWVDRVCRRGSDGKIYPMDVSGTKNTQHIFTLVRK